MSGPTGVGAIIGAGVAVVICTRVERFQGRIVLLAAFAGGMVGAFIDGTERTPAAESATNVINMLEATSTRAVFHGVLGAGLAAFIVVRYMQWRAVRPRTVPTVLTHGPSLVLTVIIYVSLALIAKDFTHTYEIARRKAMTSDLRNVTAYQQTYHDSTGVFTSDLGALHFEPSSDVEVVVDSVHNNAWSALARTRHLTTTCRMSDFARQPGSEAAASAPACTEARRWF